MRLTTLVLGWSLLGVALVSLTIYLLALWRLLHHPPHPGLRRTAACRVVAAVLYVGVALATLTDADAGPVIGLGVFIAAQLMWQAMAVLDVRLARRKGNQ